MVVMAYGGHMDTYLEVDIHVKWIVISILKFVCMYESICICGMYTICIPCIRVTCCPSVFVH